MSSDIGQENLAALGRMALASTGIEMAAEQLIWAILGLEEPAGRTLTESWRATRLAEMVGRLAPRAGLDSELVASIQDFARGAKTVFQIRNENLHGVWVALETGDVVRLKSVLVDGQEGPEFQTDLALASDGQLVQVASGMEDFGKSAHALLTRVRAGMV